MTNVLDRLPAGARVAIIRLRSLGDCVLTTPALCAAETIAARFEDRGGGGGSFRPGVRRQSRCRSNPRAERRQPGAVSAASGAQFARRRHQRALDAGSGVGPARRIRPFSLPTDVQRRASRARRRFWAQRFETDRKVHTAEHLASAMFYLGVPPTEIPRARLFAAPHVPDRVPTPSCIPSRREAEKTWPQENFLAVAETSG